VFPDEMELVLTLLKMPSLYPVLLRKSWRQLNIYLESNQLIAPTQSAYRRFHTTKTALLKVMNDLMLCVDRREAVLLAPFELGAAVKWEKFE
jgi:hypothetical protein